MAHPRNPPIRAKIFSASRIIANFVPNFVDMATGVGREKMQLAAFDGPPPKLPLWAQKSRKNLLREPSYSPFCAKFRCHGNGSRSGKNEIASFRWKIPRTPCGRKNLAKISYANRVITNFVPNFVAMATGVGREKIKFPAFDGKSRKHPIGAKISYSSRIIANFVPNFVDMATGSDGGKCNWQHSMAHHRNPLYSAKISQKSPTRAEL